MHILQYKPLQTSQLPITISIITYHNDEEFICSIYKTIRIRQNFHWLKALPMAHTLYCDIIFYGGTCEWVSLATPQQFQHQRLKLSRAPCSYQINGSITSTPIPYICASLHFLSPILPHPLQHIASPSVMTYLGQHLIVHGYSVNSTKCDPLRSIPNQLNNESLKARV